MSVAEKSVKAAASKSTGVSSDSDQAFIHIVKTMEGNMSKLRKSIELFQMYEGAEGD